jgi:Bax protein
MSTGAADALALDGKRGSTSRPGDEFDAVFRESPGYRQAVIAGLLCAVMSAGLIAMDLTGFLAPETGEIATAALPLSPDLSQGLPMNRVRSAGELMARLKAHHLWEMPADNVIPPVLFANYPDNFDLLQVDIKKRAFLHALLPAALLAREEIARERTALEKILVKFEDPDQLVFEDEGADWHDRLSGPEIEFIDHLAGKYRSRNAADLLARVDSFPVSLIMAQAALESSWGSSRFAEKGNNIFGMWTWGERGLVPAAREEGKDHKIAIYDTILGSVRAYLLTLNRLPAYRALRQLRRDTSDPLLLADGLHHYSERGAEYVTELKKIIRYNQLERYDSCTLAGELPVVAAAGIKLSRL